MCDKLHAVVTHKFSVSVGSRRQDILVDKREICVIEHGVVGADVDKQSCSNRYRTLQLQNTTTVYLFIYLLVYLLSYLLIY